MDTTSTRVRPGVKFSLGFAPLRAGKATRRSLARKTVHVRSAGVEGQTLVKPPPQVVNTPPTPPANGSSTRNGGMGAGSFPGYGAVPPGNGAAVQNGTLVQTPPVAPRFPGSGPPVPPPGMGPPLPPPGTTPPLPPPGMAPPMAPPQAPQFMSAPGAVPRTMPTMPPSYTPAPTPPNTVPMPPPAQGWAQTPPTMPRLVTSPPTAPPTTPMAPPTAPPPQFGRPMPTGFAPMRPPGMAPPTAPFQGMPPPAMPQMRPPVPPPTAGAPLASPPTTRPPPPSMPLPYQLRPAGAGVATPPITSAPAPPAMPSTSFGPPGMMPPAPPGFAPPLMPGLRPPGQMPPPAWNIPNAGMPVVAPTAPVPPPGIRPTMPSVPATPPTAPSASAPTLAPPPASGAMPGMLAKPELRRPEAPTLLNKPSMFRPHATQVVRPSADALRTVELPRVVQLPFTQIPAAAPVMPKPSMGVVAAPQVAPMAPASVQVPASAPERPKIEFVQEDDDLVFEEAEEDEDKKKKKFKKGKKGREEAEAAAKALAVEKQAKGGRKVITAEMKREARKMRKEERESKQVTKDKEEIFEVGEEGMSVMELADMLQVNEADVISNLFMKGVVCGANSMLDKNLVKLVAKEYEVMVLDKVEASVTDLSKKKGNELIEEEDLDSLVPRPPVVTVMGHVDHGKTSLLDFIRKTKVASGEAGGITQQIGAYTTEVQADEGTKQICFMDTPGHEAFSAMRARGARITDIAIIIVAADDGVQPQTREAISHAQAAEVPIVVAINKIDKPGADVERTKQQLLESNLVPEEWGGTTPMVPLSAKSGKGVDDLLLTLLLMAEEMQLMANPQRPAKGTVIEANLDKKTGTVATLLVQAGTLRPGDVVQAGCAYGKVKQLLNHHGKAQRTAGPGVAVQMIGLNTTPMAGDTFEVWRSEAMARMAAEEVEEALREQRMLANSSGGSMVTLSSLATLDEDSPALSGTTEGDVQQKLNLVIKGDTTGVVEAIKSALSSLPQEGVLLRFLWTGAGDITQADVDLAAASNGLLLAFNLTPKENIATNAKERGVNLRTYKVIYDLLDDVRAAMEGKLAPVEEKVFLGRAEVKAVFGKGSKRVAGCAVMEGKLRKGCTLVIRRKKDKVYEGVMTSLKRVKDAVEEVSAGLECGVACGEAFCEWQEGDLIEAFEVVTKTRKLEDVKARTAVDAAVALA